MTDTLDTIAGLRPDSPVALLRRQRDVFVRHTQGSHDALITPTDPGGVSLAERAAVAAHVAELHGDIALLGHYQAQQRASAVTPRLAAILPHVRRIAMAPGSATPVDIEALRAAGLAPRDIVVITQIVAFVSYQVRLIAGLRALAADTVP